MGKEAEAEKKKGQILEAVKKILGKQGYSAATISQVAATAGVSRGLVHYHFKNKEEMLARVIQDNMKFILEMMSLLFRQSNSAAELAANLTAGLKGVVIGEPDLFNIYFESWAVARHNPLVAVEVKAAYRNFLALMEDELERAEVRKIINPTLPREGLAALLTSIFDGLGLLMVTEQGLAEREAVWEATESGILGLLGERV